MKFSVSWWIHGAGRITRGKDIIETPIDDFSPDDATELIQEDLDREDSKSGIGFYGYAATGDFKANLPNFMRIHKELCLENHHSEISNWRILKVKEVSGKEEEKETET